MAEAIIIKSPSDIEHMRRAGKIASEARSIGRQAVAAGVSTREIDREIHDFITKSGAIPTFLGYGGFPASACISVNEEIIHGIPGKRKSRLSAFTNRIIFWRNSGIVSSFASEHP